MPVKKITHGEFIDLLKTQGVPREHFAFVCPICGTVQSMRSLVEAGAGEKLEDVERYIGFSCIGRYTKAGPHKPGTPPGKGCDWTLGGLLQLHNLEVTLDGKTYQHFEPATPEQAKLLMSTCKSLGGSGQ